MTKTKKDNVKMEWTRGIICKYIIFSIWTTFGGIWIIAGISVHTETPQNITTRIALSISVIVYFKIMIRIIKWIKKYYELNNLTQATKSL